MLDEKKEAVKEPKNEPEVKKEAKKSEVKTKDYTVLKAFTSDKVNPVGSTISVEVGSDQEKYLLTNKHINKHGVSRPN